MQKHQTAPLITPDKFRLGLCENDKCVVIQYSTCTSQKDSSQFKCKEQFSTDTRITLTDAHVQYFRCLLSHDNSIFIWESTCAISHSLMVWQVHTAEECKVWPKACSFPTALKSFKYLFQFSCPQMKPYKTSVHSTLTARSICWLTSYVCNANIITISQATVSDYRSSFQPPPPLTHPILALWHEGHQTLYV